MENKTLYLIYVNPIGKDSNNTYEYEFFFSETPEIAWGEKKFIFISIIRVFTYGIYIY